MAKSVKTAGPEIDDAEALALDVCTMMAVAQNISKKLFGDASDADAAFGVYDRLIIDADTDEEAGEDLTKAQELAKEIFSVPAPTPAMVFGVFDRVFAPLDEDEDE